MKSAAWNMTCLTVVTITMILTSIIRGDSVATHIYVACFLVVASLLAVVNFLLEAMRVHSSSVIHAIAIAAKKGGSDVNS